MNTFHPPIDTHDTALSQLWVLDLNGNWNKNSCLTRMEIRYFSCIRSIIGKFKILIVKRTYDVFSMDFCNCSSSTCICVSENGTTNFWENKKIYKTGNDGKNYETLSTEAYGL